MPVPSFFTFVSFEAFHLLSLAFVYHRPRAFVPRHLKDRFGWQRTSVGCCYPSTGRAAGTGSLSPSAHHSFGAHSQTATRDSAAVAVAEPKRPCAAGYSMGHLATVAAIAVHY